MDAVGRPVQQRAASGVPEPVPRHAPPRLLHPRTSGQPPKVRFPCGKALFGITMVGRWRLVTYFIEDA